MPKAISIAQPSIVALVLLYSMTAALAHKRCGPGCPKALQDQEELEHVIRNAMPIGTKCSRVLETLACSFGAGANIAFSIMGKVAPEPTIWVDLSFEKLDPAENPKRYVASIYEFFVALGWSEKNLDTCLLTKSSEHGKAMTARNSKQGTMLNCSFEKEAAGYHLQIQLEPGLTP